MDLLLDPPESPQILPLFLSGEFPGVILPLSLRLQREPEQPILFPLFSLTCQVDVRSYLRVKKLLKALPEV